MSNKEENVFEMSKKIEKEKFEAPEEEFIISPRETEVLKLIAAGYSNKEISDSLNISQRTVDGHKANLLIKTGSKNVVVLLKWALNKNIISF